jgi:hypothetical protein
MNSKTITSETYEISFLVTKYKENEKWVLYNWLDYNTPQKLDN